MNQIPNIEETHNTREVEESFFEHPCVEYALRLVPKLNRELFIFEISNHIDALKETLTQDRQAIADVLCAKLEGVQTYGHEYLISKEEVKKIIKQTLSNKDV